jgi:adenylate kinase
MFGPPGAGKGTQSNKIIDLFKFKHISTGDMFRAHIAEETDLGKKVKDLLDNGILVPDSITIDMLENEIKQLEDLRGLILDGFPRTIPQAEALDHFFEKRHEKVDLVLQLEVDQSIVMKRIEERQKVSGRLDDDASKLLKRLDEYFQKTIHVIPYYEAQGKLQVIKGVGDIDEIFGNIKTILQKSMLENYR